MIDTKQMIAEIDVVIQQAVATLAAHQLKVEPGYGEVKNLLGEVNPYSVTDLTYLKPHGGAKEITQLCKEAEDLQAKTVCVQPINVALALELLKDSHVSVITVEGFPLGAAHLDHLITEVSKDFERGVAEVDIVFPHKYMADADYLGALKYLKALRLGAHGILKVILETSDYAKLDIAIMSLICKAAGVDFVKTSTGFSTGGATVFDVALMRRCVGNVIGVKASGGIKTTEDAMQMIAHGATRIGASSLKSTSTSGY
jgi:deoxyribose-phosphate aldolase